MKPPAAGPTTAEIPHTAPKSPWTRARALQLEDVPHYGYGHGLHGPCPETLEGTEEDEGPHALRGAGEHAAEQEEEDAGQVHGLPAVGVRELAEDRPRHGRREQVRGESPRVELEAAELPDHGRHRRPYDRRIEGGQKRPDERGERYESLAALAQIPRDSCYLFAATLQPGSDLTTASAFAPQHAQHRTRYACRGSDLQQSLEHR